MPHPIAIGADHAGFAYKEHIKNWLEANGYPVTDFGTYSPDSADYADFAHPVALAVESGQASRGILVCGSGEGVSMTANKHQGIRAALVWQPAVAELTRQHNDANVLCLPERFISLEDALQAVHLFLTTAFEGGRHQRRVDKMMC
ncbi:ribose 5-phosphate isomerase B [Spirosoma utsteinense]|uniref:Ribose 5-phosphate isomerase B n=1 Tax=Spirosoma utsteinense TaxID=2585773 RepID=A0ABR6W0C7_9BACT|nr:ribose 5-phosphate isomerase B [Spirosoma utsteinense]MBC3784663.1 ribose 5-phosphate isomerase B [Spirosoma utsteinense]MBC3789583.1 ribose 5-phosphate isomerase B [Spirosoma utsteinense]